MELVNGCDNIIVIVHVYDIVFRVCGAGHQPRKAPATEDEEA